MYSSVVFFPCSVHLICRMIKWVLRSQGITIFAHVKYIWISFNEYFSVISALGNQIIWEISIHGLRISSYAFGLFPSKFTIWHLCSEQNCHHWEHRTPNKNVKSKSNMYMKFCGKGPEEEKDLEGSGARFYSSMEVALLQKWCLSASWRYRSLLHRVRMGRWAWHHHWSNS